MPPHSLCAKPGPLLSRYKSRYVMRAPGVSVKRGASAVRSALGVQRKFTELFCMLGFPRIVPSGRLLSHSSSTPVMSHSALGASSLMQALKRGKERSKKERQENFFTKKTLQFVIQFTDFVLQRYEFFLASRAVSGNYRPHLPQKW